MKKALIIIMIVVMLFSILGCSSAKSGVSLEQLENTCNIHNLETEELFVKKSPDGLTFETVADSVVTDIKITGTADDEENINYIKFENNSFQVDYISEQGVITEKALLSLLEKFMNNPESVNRLEFSALYCFDEIAILYDLFSGKQKDSQFDFAIEVLSSSKPIEINGWSINVELNASEQSLIIEAIY